MMAVDPDDGRVKVTDGEILEFIGEHGDPVVTAPEVADRFDIAYQSANYRLLDLRDRGLVIDKKTGASAKVWYLPHQQE